MKTHIQNLFIALAILAGTNYAAAQGTAFTYQGKVTDNGTNFTGNGQFEFALLYSTNTSSQATAAITGLNKLSGDSIAGINVINGGSGYVTPPTVTIVDSGEGPGSGATAIAVISGGTVTSINITSGGSGYNFPPITSVTIAPPPANFTNVFAWSNDGTSSGEPAAAVSVGVGNGLFTVVLGDITLSNMTAIPASLFTQPNLLLQIWFNDGVNGFAALSPLQPLTPAPQAVFANTASNLLGALPASQLNGSVPAGALTSVPATNLTGSVPVASLTSVPAASLTGTIVQSNLGTANTYIPTIGDGTHNFTTSTQSGYYTKVGNLVFVEIWLVWTSKGSATSTSAVEISLPFPVASPRATFPPAYLDGFTFNNELIAGANNGLSYLYLYNVSNSGGAASDLNVSSCGNSGEIQVSGFYRWQ